MVNGTEANVGGVLLSIEAEGVRHADEGEDMRRLVGVVGNVGSCWKTSGRKQAAYMQVLQIATTLSRQYVVSS